MAEVAVNRQLATQVARDLTMFHAQELLRGATCCADGPCEVQQRIHRLNRLLERSAAPG